MTTLLLRLLFLSLLLLCCVSPSSFFTINYNPVDGLVACRHRQIQAFKQFKNEFDTRGCNHSDYSNGVLCDNSTGSIRKLRLNACLSGTLKPNSSLFRFHQLRYLDLSENNLTSSSLPSEFGNLNKLEVLSLYSNGFLGQVPSSFSNLNLLYLLDLCHNKLSGNIPLVQNLTKLSLLKLSFNRFSGTLNPNNSLFELHHLRYLNLASNNFTFSVLPSEFGNLNRLEVLSLAFNNFFGQVPTTFSNLTSLTELYLSHNELTGSFPLVQNLTNLNLLGLSENHFYGTIPSSIFSMPFLSYLSLNTNHFTGPIEAPNSSFPSRINTLYLGYNHFEGSIIEPISKLTNLKSLDLSFLNISYPINLSPFSSLTSLSYLDLSFLNISYPINLSLFSSLTSLSSLDLSGNTISPASLSSSDSYILLTLEMFSLKHCGISEFPNILKTLDNLEYINLSYNRIQGKIPEWLWSLPQLSTVDFMNNSFNGFEGSTESLVNSSVELLNLMNNNFGGPLPHLPLSINFFFANGNNFTGEIPLSICYRSLLAMLDLSYNNLVGPIPQCLSNNLQIVTLRNNNLEGIIPDVFYNGALTQTLDVGYNRLTGKLPRSLLNSSSLKYLNVENNIIEDTFPFWLKSLPNLQVLILRSNKFYGPISPSHQGPLGFPELRVLEISDNKFTGSLPSSYFVNWKASLLTMNEDGNLYMVYDKVVNGTIHYFYMDSIDLQYKGSTMKQVRVLTSYATIDFSGNKLEGKIPESIGLLKALIALNLSNNAFTGHIPLSLASLVKLESLDLSRNQLSGTIPNGLRTLSFLEYINVSHNQLKGEIPQGTQITGQPISSFEGNAGLCGLPLQQSCFGNNKPTIHQPKQEDKGEEEEEEEEEVLNWKAVVIGYGVGVLFGLSIAQGIASYKPELLVKIVGAKKV